MKLQFNIGDNAVHVAHGVGVISAIETRSFNQGEPQIFYVMNIDDNGSSKKVFVPVGVGDRLRPVIDQATALFVVEYLRAGKADPDLEGQSWNRRYREYMEMITTGNLMEIAKVYLALVQVKRDKGLSFGEQALLNSARQRLETELALVEGIKVLFVGE